ncbi:5-formyltetrahydrofolate cyclo-ligase [Magnetospira sp. QH-2]|uniref:5-formyltetrahydrofolate cyclo-ligase n=1 Tax=Magnetospira sp. (strain QH-2) TaxID=1288970 RepID=UPI0003E8147C|nr:5-formyltetrahydrofolate cyclo-ligase [Magnetospira sp. QH-2]CCQ73304.1 Putative 5-formyltetrahydrofolate cyclo-ligase [Magnetospira sp. QH-2]
MAKDNASTGLELAAAKDHLRAKARDRRRGLAAADPLAKKKIARITLDLEPDRILAGYWAIGDELDPSGVLIHHMSLGHRTALPAVVDRDAPLVFREWMPGTPLVGGLFGTREPDHQSAVMRPTVLLVPLLAFDRRGYRLGWGGGYYDRTIEMLKQDGDVKTIGIAYAGQEVAQVPHDDRDQPLDWILTQEGLIQGTTETGDS